MESIGLRELRQHASRYVRAAAKGLTIQVTDRGRAVAWLVPHVPSGVVRLRQAGRVRPARRSIRDLPPLPPNDRPDLTTLLTAARRDER
jgi:prevent-host-death family protein